MSATETLLQMSPVELLSGSPIPELRRLVVTENEQEVVISGRVSSFYIKQLAQESVRVAVAGRQLQNRVVVGS